MGKLYMTRPSKQRKPVLLALAASFLLTILIVAGSRNLEHYDAALFGYTIASVVAFGAIVFRYAIWLQRPATRVYWRRGWKLYLQREKFAQNTANAAKTIATNLVGQRFIFKRGFSRWAMHFLIFPAHWDPKLRIPRGQVVAAASIVSPKY